MLLSSIYYINMKNHKKKITKIVNNDENKDMILVEWQHKDMRLLVILKGLIVALWLLREISLKVQVVMILERLDVTRF